MKHYLFISGLFVLFLSGCKKSTPELSTNDTQSITARREANALQDKSTADLNKKIASLESAIKAKDKKIMSLAITVKVMSQNLSHFDKSGIWNFFNEKEFWENTYEVDPAAQCYKKCADYYAIANAQCQKITNQAEKLACVQTAYQNLVNCSGSCN